MFTPEDGSGVAGANSFIDVAYADDYWSTRGDADWQGAEETKKHAALLDATAMLSGRLRGQWPGGLYSAAQGLDVPRLGAYDVEGRPLNGVWPVLADTVCELARESLVNGSLQAALDRGGAVKREKIGPIDTEYELGAPGGRTFPVIDALLSSFTGSSEGMIELRRG